jgi:hypothetical protein
MHFVSTGRQTESLVSKSQDVFLMEADVFIEIEM